MLSVLNAFISDIWAVASLVVRASDSRPEDLSSMPDAAKYPPSTHGKGSTTKGVRNYDQKSSSDRPDSSAAWMAWQRNLWTAGDSPWWPSSLVCEFAGSLMHGFLLGPHEEFGV
ncbi:hypothetical protein TNCV_985681 [Trichonephila clavipes]|uniref:Uncharacterized protein n=1 Tax=Trichonephila clavipes TaxID=2585209 RepID=A0A8X6SI65_TRICX|nr:hypothetical protein TNCV_985681 [Trichonephila clavipes]